MTNSKHPPKTQKNWFNLHAPAPFSSNRRLGVRYVRSDIKVTLWKAGTLNLAFKSMRKVLTVKLIDISSRGILVESKTKLNVNKKVLLTLSFADNVHIQLLSTVVRKESADNRLYGIKFDRADNKLAEYLLYTQKVLMFK